MAKLKDTLKKLSFLGDFSAFLLPLVLIIFAGLLFIPTTLMQRRLRAQIEEQSIRKGANSLKSLLGGAVSNKQWEVERDYQNKYQLDANGIALLAEQTSRRQLLSYVIFPEPNETSLVIYSQFGQSYRKAIDRMFEELRARDCPTQIELDKNLRRPADSSGSVPDDASRSNTEKMIIDDLCMDVAKATNLYANRTNLTGYKFWENYNYRGKNEALSDCWYWQLASWIVKDVFETAKNINSGSQNVIDAPLKRLITVSFTPEEASAATTYSYNVPAYAAGGGVADRARPRYVLTFSDAMVQPFDARTCNELVDIVHFRLSVVVEAYAIPKFMEELCSAKEHLFTGFKDEFKEQPVRLKHNQITILDCKYSAVQPDSEEHKLYRYGNESVVKMDMVCEYAFNKSGYDPIMPKVVKDTIDKAVKKTASATPGSMPGVIQ